MFLICFEKGAPDLRNLSVHHIGCNEGDLVIICSNAVHDNFDPQVNGYNPNDLQSFVIRLNQYYKDIASNTIGNTDSSTNVLNTSHTTTTTVPPTPDKILFTLK
jgi:hypothetical protein